MQVLTEASISDLASSDSESRFAERMAESERRVFQIAYSVLANAADAEEVAQEAFLRAYREQKNLRQPEKFRAWVSRIAFRLALNRQRRRRRDWARDSAWQRSLPGSTPDGARARADSIYVDEVRQAMERLPEKLRAVLFLCALEDMDAAEAAAVLEIPVGTVRSRLHLARKRLLEEMSQ
jgi:RNA polymerase sigma-70 factor (ECF subfamily)